MIEISQATPERRKALTCSSCPSNIQTLRRCREDRWDFTEKDAAFFPMIVEKNGNFYNFCPAKSTWDPQALAIYQALLVCAETGIMLEDGALIDQADWWMDLVSWFLPYYSDIKFYSRVRAILGDSKASTESLKKGVSNRGGHRR